MRFAEYMHEWLYGDKGYYKNFKEIGKAGDFYTAVSSSAFFGASIANHFLQLLQNGKADRNGWLVEIGAHQGYLISDMIQWLYSCDESLISSMNFAIIERQPEVQQQQKEYIKNRFGDDIKMYFLSDISQLHTEYAFVVANEILDAFPCELYKDKKIAIVNDHTILWEDASDEIVDFAQTHSLRTGEIAVGYEEFAKSLIETIPNMDFVTFDYGEKYVRNDFSIRIYKKHETLPFFDKELVLSEIYQRADITYDVNFTHVIDAFEYAGFEAIEYETQARALVRFGIIDILQQYAKTTTQINYLKEADKIKTLISPTIMGDKFKMVHFKKQS